MTQIPDLEARLAQVQAAFDAAPAEGSKFDAPPDGDYQCLLHEYDFFEGGDPRRAFMKIRFQVQHHPEQAGRFIEKIYGIEEEDGIGYLKADLHRLGVAVEGLNIAKAISSGSLQEETLDLPVLVRVKRPPGKTNRRGEQVVNAYIQQRLGDPIRGQRGPIANTPQRAMAEATGSDVPGAEGDEFIHPGQGTLDDVPFTGEEIPPQGNENQARALREQGCECEDPVAVELAKQKHEPGTGSLDCPLPGHAPF